MTSPHKNFRFWVSNDLPCLMIFHTYCHNLMLGKLSTSGVTLQEKTLGNLHLVFSGVLFMYFSLCWFCFASFAGINHNEEYNCRLSPVGLPSEPTNIRMVLGIPNTMNVKKIIKERKKINNKVFQGKKDEKLSKIKDYN